MSTKFLQPSLTTNSSPPVVLCQYKTHITSSSRDNVEKLTDDYNNILFCHHDGWWQTAQRKRTSWCGLSEKSCQDNNHRSFHLHHYDEKDQIGFQKCLINTHADLTVSDTQQTMKEAVFKLLHMFNILSHYWPEATEWNWNSSLKIICLIYNIRTTCPILGRSSSWRALSSQGTERKHLRTLTIDCLGPEDCKVGHLSRASFKHI